MGYDQGIREWVCFVQKGLSILTSSCPGFICEIWVSFTSLCLNTFPALILPFYIHACKKAHNHTCCKSFFFLYDTEKEKEVVVGNWGYGSAGRGLGYQA